MIRSHILLGMLLATVSHLVSGCDDGKTKYHHVLKEVKDVQGTCWENHVGQRDNYAGQIGRWQTVETGEISTRGFVSIPLSAEAQRSLDEVTHPTMYHTPSVVSFLEMEIDIDTNQPNWILHGVSDRGENSQRYDSTCEVEVVKRGTEFHDPFPDEAPKPRRRQDDGRERER